MTKAYYVRITSPREGTRIKVNENTDRLIGMLRHKDKSLTVTSDEIHTDKSNELNKE
ncbi:hypothetical protein HanPI659440_Chr06g0247431 [Helianthus annuus]|nr:hypothetical protein HanPI659440_Chr06g0247431 [Helianthus annuus]